LPTKSHLESNGILAFISDFGSADSYSAEVKGAILSVDPDIRIVDVTHDVEPQGIRSAAFLVWRSAPAFPAGTVYLAVVDPGVGTRRRAVVVESRGLILVGPDNGLLSWAARRATGEDSTWRSIEHTGIMDGEQSLTFHGRDVFGPIAARLACGKLSPNDVGPIIHDPVMIPWPKSMIGEGEASGEVIHVDSFGNLIIGIDASVIGQDIEDGSLLVAGAHGCSLDASWGTYEHGLGVAVHTDSCGLVEVAVPGGDASLVTGAQEGDTVVLRWSGKRPIGLS